MDGYGRFRNGRESLGEELFKLGIITALFHGIGYIREQNDPARNGAEYTLIHVSRGASFLEEYLPKLGLRDLAPVAAKLIHYTGYEVPMDQIAVPTFIHRLLAVSARIGRHPLPDGGSLLPGKMPGPAVSEVRAGGHRPPLGAGRRRAW